MRTIWTCRPSAAHPRPVVLVHGLLANMTDNWQTMSPLLANNGYCVFALTYGTDADPPSPFGAVRRADADGAKRGPAFDVRRPRARRARARTRSTSSATPRARRCPTTTSSTSAARRRSRATSASPASSTARRCTASARSPPRYGDALPRRARPDLGLVRLVPAVPRRLGLHQEDRGPRAGRAA